MPGAGRLHRLPASVRYTCRTAEDPASPAAPAEEASAGTLAPPAPAGVTAQEESCPAQTSQFPGCRGQIGQQADAWTGGDTGTRPRAPLQMGPPRPASGPRSLGGPSGAWAAPRGGRAARGWGHRGAAANGQPRRANSRRARAPLGLPAPQQLQGAEGEEEAADEDDDEEDDKEDEDEERDRAPQPEPLPSGLPPTSGR